MRLHSGKSRSSKDGPTCRIIFLVPLQISSFLPTGSTRKLIAPLVNTSTLILKGAQGFDRPYMLSCGSNRRRKGRLISPNLLSLYWPLPVRSNTSPIAPLGNTGILLPKPVQEICCPKRGNLRNQSNWLNVWCCPSSGSFENLPSGTKQLKYALGIFTVSPKSLVYITFRDSGKHGQPPRPPKHPSPGLLNPNKIHSTGLLGMNCGYYWPPFIPSYQTH